MGASQYLPQLSLMIYCTSDCPVSVACCWNLLEDQVSSQACSLFYGRASGPQQAYNQYLLHSRNKLTSKIYGCLGVVLGVLKLSPLSKAGLRSTNRKPRGCTVALPQANTAYPTLQPQSHSLITVNNTITSNGSRNRYSEKLDFFLWVNNP